MKNIFFKDKKKDTPNPETHSATIVRPLIIGAPYVATTGNIMPGSGTDYSAHLEKAMKHADQPGLDYLEFAAAITSLDGQPLSVPQKYIFTFPSYQASGVTTAKLIESAGLYINVLAKEKQDFDNELANSRETGIRAKQSAISFAQKEIDNLTKQIQDKTAEIGRMNSEVNTAQITLSGEEAAFNTAYNNKVAIINSHIENIKNYLPK